MARVNLTVMEADDLGVAKDDAARRCRPRSLRGVFAHARHFANRQLARGDSLPVGADNADRLLPSVPLIFEFAN